MKSIYPKDIILELHVSLVFQPIIMQLTYM